MQHEHTEHVAAPPDAVYAAIANVSNLPRFVPQMTSARTAGEGQVEIAARYEGREQSGLASFRADDGERRIEWSAPSGYHGWMQVDADGDGSRLTLFLDTPHDAARDHDIAATLDAIRMLVEAEV
jgi:carbon monoxide dehydrogenase subunit G